MKHLEEVIIDYDKKLMKANIEIERLNNIIKEVRELVESKYRGELPSKILEILDKGE